MKLRTIVSFVCYFLVAILCIFFGFRYLTASQFMPYHAVALGVSWSELDSHYQTLLLSLIRVAGGGMLAGGIAIGFLLLIPLRRKELWARWAILIIGLIVGGSAVYATLSVKFRTPASPPWIPAIVAVLLILVGSLIYPNRSVQRSPEPSETLE
jgi:peptidoglycan/LPS O-acetylase OafA/YrhL